jgi:hypothetical protein
MASRVRNVSCPSCAKNFTQTGFQSHLRQTTDPHCAALYSEIVDKELSDHDPQIFEGDFFGGHDDYMDDDDFGQLHDPESGYNEDDDSDEEEEQPNLENGWEPERPGARAALLQTEDPQEAHQAGDLDEPTPTHLEARRRLVLQIAMLLSAIPISILTTKLVRP